MIVNAVIRPWSQWRDLSDCQMQTQAWLSIHFYLHVFVPCEINPKSHNI